MSERFNEDQLEIASGVFKAIAHPIRLRILNVLVENESLNMSSISDILSLDQPLVSHHLGILKNASVVKSIRDGRAVSYSLGMKQIKEILDCVETCFDEH